MLTGRTLAECRDVLTSFEGVHARWHALMCKAVEEKNTGALRDLFDEAPGVVTEHDRYMDLWKVIAQAEHEHDTTEVVLPEPRPQQFSEG